MERRKLDLKSICTYKTAKEDSDFVGIRYDSEQKKFFIDFPLGYCNKKLFDSNADYSKEQEIELKKDILNLLNILCLYGTNNQTEKSKDNSKHIQDNIPIFAYLYVIRYYLKNGYYKPKDIIYSKSATGKINWNKTIKSIKPIVYDENNVVFLDFITKKNSIAENELITTINKYCVYEAFLNIGCLLTSYMPPDPHIKLKERLFINVLKTKLSKTYNDKERLLFQNMLDIILYNSKEHNGNSFFYGTFEFHNVWEKMIDNYFGVTKTDEMYPIARWINTKQSKIEFIPDTIMIPTDNEKNMFVLDAKYYRGGVNEDLGSLPRAESIPKQLVYAKKLYKVFNYIGRNNYTIYNAFILPSDCFAKHGKILEYVAPVEVDWLLPEEERLTFNHIQGIRLDVRSMMYNNTGDKSALFKELANIIETNTKKIMDS